jgi:hypothetical protein
MDRHQLGAVGEGRLDLHLAQHRRDAIHDVVRRQDLAARLHQLGHRPTVAGGLEHERAEDRDGLRVVQAQAAFPAAPGQVRGVREHQPFLLMRGQQHAPTVVARCFGRVTTPPPLTFAIRLSYRHARHRLIGNR